MGSAWVQICETRMGREHGVQSWQSIEAIQSRELDHPSIVKTYAHTTVMIKVPTALALPASPELVKFHNSCSVLTGPWQEVRM